MSALLARFLMYLPVTSLLQFCSVPLLSFTCYVPTLSLSLSLSYLYPPQLLLAGRSGAEKFGRDQAKGGQTGSLCVYIEEQETVRGGDGVASTDRVQWGNGGGLPKKKKKIQLQLVKMPVVRKHTQQSVSCVVCKQH